MLTKLLDKHLVREIEAGSFAKDDVLAGHLDELFPGDWAAAFWSLSAVKRHAVAAVTSGIHYREDDIPHLRRNLLMCEDRFLLKCRFEESSDDIRWMFERIRPRALLSQSYNSLPSMIAQDRKGEDSVFDSKEEWVSGGRLETLICRNLELDQSGRELKR
ncbi:hypothetical protein M3P21_22095 [Ruegeria sp. 2012CJ41-6]|uniref:Uncharacterized protein n=1 Tax=Ruegeria spongiae TaxID=2942209 RepID=A0ABT0Q8P0_9RHOB|nr:hypothetical protein [Ruegeria spongiae]MCL6286188.1 hypothetical protein [Ruegeria spongiae]